LPTDPEDPGRCPSVNSEGGRCARLVHEPGESRHARGYDRWSEDGDVPTRAVKDGPTIVMPEGFEADIPQVSGHYIDLVLRDRLVVKVTEALGQLGIAGDETRSGQEIAAKIAVDTVIEQLRDLP